MRFICAEEKPLSEDDLPAQIPWQLLQAIAIIQLYLESRWIEPINPIKYPFSLLYHQTMSILAAKEVISPAALAQEILKLPPFTNISQDDYKTLLRYLLDINHIQKTEHDKLMIGLAGEKIVNKFQFYAVFADNQEYTVKQGTTEIGSIVTPPAVGNQFGLAGKSWEVLEVDLSKKVILAKQVEGKGNGQDNINWRGGSGNIHGKILQRMRQVLLEDTEYSYLQNNAKLRLQEVRKLVSKAGLDKSNIIKLDKNRCCIFPWMGTVGYRTLERLLNSFCRESLEISSIGGVNPYYLTLKVGKDKFANIYSEIVGLCEQRITAEHLVSHAEAPKLQKYDQFIPDELLRKAFFNDYLDMEEMRRVVEKW
jgi:ATP-dependent Lhr-like helicase